VWWEMAVEELGELELDEEAQEQRHIVDTLEGQIEGGVQGGTPTRDLGKSSLYRGEQDEGNIHENIHKHDKYIYIILIHNFSFTVRLVHKIRVSAGL